MSNKILKQCLLIVLLYSYSASALRLHQNYDNQSAYLEGLLAQQQEFQQQIQALNNHVNETISNAASESDLQSKIGVLERGVLEQQSSIFQASTTIIPPLVLNDQCQNITAAGRARIIQKCNKTIVDIQRLQAQLQSPSSNLSQSDPRVQQLLISTNSQLYYLQTIQQVLLTNCSTTAILSPTVYQSNIYAPNWITGNQTINDIVNQYIARSQQFDNVTNCPLDRPFYNNTACTQCKYPFNVFDMKQRKCVSCPEGYTLDQNQKVCKQATPNATNPSANSSTYGVQPYTSTQYDVPCPSKTPYFNGSQCVGCLNNNQVFNYTTLNCSSCPNNSYWNSASRTCQQNRPNATNPVGRGYTIGAPLQNSTQNINNDTNAVYCPEQTPYFNNSTCIACPQPKYLFNLTSLTCTQCPTNTTFNTSSHLCQPITYSANATNPSASNRTVGPVNSSPSSIACPEAQPFFNGTNCVNCTGSKPYFNTSSLNCTSCKGGYLNTTQNKCYYYNATNPSANSTTLHPLNNTDTDVYQVYCPTKAPYWNGSHCVGCNDPSAPYFDQSTNQCVGCPAGSSLNPTTKQCEQQLPYNASNPVAINSSIGDIGTADPQYDIACPQARPFFVQQTQECIACTGETPLFDVNTSQCANCPAGTQYNVSVQSCENVAVLPYASNLNNTNWVSARPFGDYVQTGNGIANGTYQACPTQTPYYNGAQCVSCQNGRYFNITSSRCESCPSGTTFRNTSKKCLPDAPLALTNPNTASNLTYSKESPAQWKAWYANNQTSYPEAQDCTEPTPYYNGIGCIDCSETYPYFDLDMMDCVRCPNGYTYKNGQCVNTSQGTPSPNIASMAATAFSHRYVGHVQYRHRVI